MYLGIDIGTSGVKAVVIDAAGAVLGQGSAPLTVSRPHPLWSEQDPEAWWQATEAAVGAIPAALRAEVRGIGLAGQMHGATLLDAEDRPLRPAILWNDGRSHEECAAMEAAVPDLHAIAGNLAMPGFTAPKLLWVRRHEPDIFAATRTVLLPKDFVRLRMTGDKASDLSDAAGTIWLDVAQRDWSDALLAATGLDRSHMPRLVEGPDEAGRLRADVAARWGMATVPVAGGGGDNAAGAVGVGVVADGDALLSLGTSGVIFVATDRYRANPQGAVHAFCHCLPGLWHQMAVHLSAASCIDWVARLTGADGPAAVFARAETVGPAGGGELFLPYLSGERTPHNDALVRGAFLRLDHDSDPARLAQAVLEGVAFAFADGLDALRGAGTRVERLSVIGGGARSAYWGRILSAALAVPLVYLRGGEVGPALGGARLAQLMVEGGDPRAICLPPPVERVVEPDPADIARLAPKLAAFRAAYPHITPKTK
ncbi:xylulokinase [Sphingomonas morindae]|uniref:Xylulose kinase n=1 Tax=Sphingomonas morindae TaxID=1541170 RepID=A0ABY4XDM5_9SPHN|nr:xylulokinase [Sphingomonas morindae]USI75022.1 xylulokinase [Sphingomonas morindae]